MNEFPNICCKTIVFFF
jgi:hypothetical protein